MSSPILILGVLPRSGTNFLSNLLALHPDCSSAPLWEDYFLYHSHHLVAFATSPPPPPHDNGFDSTEQSRLLARLGEGLIAYQAHRLGCGDKRVLGRSPSIKNIANAKALFPDAHVLVVTRDGRDVVESTARTWNVPLARTTLMWARAAHVLTKFMESRPDDGRFRLVRYEDLHEATEVTMRSVLGFLGLPVDAYDFGRALELPVRGSSTHGRKGPQDPIDWSKTIARDTRFKPVGRWSETWSDKDLANFSEVAGDGMRALGYAI